MAGGSRGGGPAPFSQSWRLIGECRPAVGWSWPGVDGGELWGEQAGRGRERGAFVLEAQGFLATPGWGLCRVPRGAFWEGRSELSCV